MNITDARGLVLKFYEKNNSINVDDDYKKIMFLSGDEDRDKAAITLALEGLKAVNIISSIVIKDKLFWVLQRPLISLNQTIELSYTTADFISGVINEHCDITEDEGNRADVANLREKDIANLGLISKKMMDFIEGLDDEPETNEETGLE